MKTIRLMSGVGSTRLGGDNGGASGISCLLGAIENQRETCWILVTDPDYKAAYCALRAVVINYLRAHFSTQPRCVQNHYLRKLAELLCFDPDRG